MTLHIINSSAQPPSLETLFNQCAGGDEIVLLDSVSTDSTNSAAIIDKYDQAITDKSIPLYRLNEENNQQTLPATKGINYSEFVALTVKHEKCVSWY